MAKRKAHENGTNTKETSKSAAMAAEGGPETSGRSDSEEYNSRVVYVGHLPHGFFEEGLLGFFSQFGKLTRCRVSRSKKTGKVKHYAFLEFQYPEVAKIAASTMDGYFMFAQRIVAKVLRPDQIHPKLFKGANRKFKQIPWRKIELDRQNQPRTPEEQAKRAARLIRRDKQRQKKIQAAGIDYEYEGLEAAQLPKSKKIKFSD